MTDQAPSREAREAARDERRAATAEREAPDPASPRPAVAGVPAWLAEWVMPYRRAWVPPG